MARRPEDERLTGRGLNLIEEELILGGGPGRYSPSTMDEKLIEVSTSPDINELKNQTRFKPQIPTKDSKNLFRSQITEEVEAAKSSFAQTQKEMGVGGPQGQAIANKNLLKGIRVGGKIVAQKELQEHLDVTERVIQDLVQTAGFADQAMASKYEAELRIKINDAREDMLKKALQAKRELVKREIDKNKRSAFASTLGSVAGALAGTIIAPGVGTLAGAGAGGAAGGFV